MEEATPTKDVLATTLSMMKKFHMEKRYWDVQIEIGNEFFHCQRSLLAAISEFFDTMFCGGFEYDTASDKPIILHELDATVFSEILSFHYTGELCVNDSNIRQLLLMDDYLHLRTRHLKERCVEYLKNHARSERLEPMSNALHLLAFAVTKEEDVLIDILSAHICQHLYHYSTDTELAKVTFQTLNTLLKFGKNYILSLPGSQDVMLKIIHSWINHDREERGQHRCKLMKSINFAYVSPQYTSLIINRLENLADKVVKVTEDMTPALAELETLRNGVDIDLTDGDARLNAPIHLRVTNVREIKIGMEICSSFRVISNLSWKISIERSQDNDLAAYLYCRGTDEASEWGCWASAVFTIASSETGKPNLVRKLARCLFKSGGDHCIWGFDKFMPWNDLVDEGNGYILDDSFSLVVRVYADIPFRPNQVEFIEEIMVH